MTDDLKKRFRDHNVFDYADWDAVIDRVEELEAALSHYACGCKEDKCTPDKLRCSLLRPLCWSRQRRHLPALRRDCG